MDNGSKIMFVFVGIAFVAMVYGMSWVQEHELHTITGKISTVSHSNSFNNEYTTVFFFGTGKSVTFWGYHDFTVERTYTIKYHGSLSGATYVIDSIIDSLMEVK